MHFYPKDQDETEQTKLVCYFSIFPWFYMQFTSFSRIKQYSRYIDIFELKIEFHPILTYSN